jgi:hypothetical protein
MFKSLITEWGSLGNNKNLFYNVQEYGFIFRIK